MKCRIKGLRPCNTAASLFRPSFRGDFVFMQDVCSAAV